MADYTNSKPAVGGLVPQGAIETAFDRFQPLVTPEDIRSEFLFGIPLMSNMKDPVTGKRALMTDDLIKKYINKAVLLAEVETHIIIMPTKFREKYPFDRQHYAQFSYFLLNKRPIYSVDKLSVTPSNNVDVYTVPNDWVETANLAVGQINVIPMTIAFQNGGFIPASSAGGSAFLAILGQSGWIPAYWQVEYTAGFKDGMIPTIVNELIGCVASILILRRLAATYAESTSHSLGLDGMSQSISSPGPELYVSAIQQLEDQKKMLIGKLKNMYGLKLTSGVV
jgi:hypothetical protein